MGLDNSGFAPGRHKIDSYGGGGFRFADMSHRGSIVALPSGVRAFSLDSAADMEDALSLALAEPAGSIEFLIIGVGATAAASLPAASRARLRAAGVMVEAMATGAAVRTYNMLLDEDRRVAAILVAV